MKQTKIGLFQILIAFIVSLIMGSSALADDDNVNDVQWHENLQAWFDSRVEAQPEKADHWQKVYDNKLAEHNSEYHSGDDSGPSECPTGTIWVDLNGNEVVDEPDECF
jgi:hypothetical protein